MPRRRWSRKELTKTMCVCVRVNKNTKIFGGICIYIKKMANKSP